MTDQGIVLIPQETVVEFKEKVSALRHDWADEMARIMSKLSKQTVTKVNVFNIGNGIKKSNIWKRIYVQAALEIIDKENKTNQEVIDQTKKIA